MPFDIWCVFCFLLRKEIFIVVSRRLPIFAAARSPFDSERGSSADLSPRHWRFPSISATAFSTLRFRSSRRPGLYPHANSTSIHTNNGASTND